ncbi:MAG: hypothetical protein P1P76_09065, partial [Anaerolineales bacterium]|nr:hypothetical protein [Anaerolineales bacterium]
SARPGKKRPSFRLSFLPSQIPVAKRRRKMRLSKQEGKNHRAAIEGTVREVKHPFPGGKLPVRGLFRVTCLMVGSAAMTNVRRIHHYWQEKRKEERRKMAAEMGGEDARQEQGMSLSSILRALFTRQRSSMPLSKAYVGC